MKTSVFFVRAFFRCAVRNRLENLFPGKMTAKPPGRANGGKTTDAGKRLRRNFQKEQAWRQNCRGGQTAAQNLQKQQNQPRASLPVEDCFLHYIIITRFSLRPPLCRTDSPRLLTPKSALETPFIAPLMRRIAHFRNSASQASFFYHNPSQYTILNHNRTRTAAIFYFPMTRFPIKPDFPML